MNPLKNLIPEKLWHFFYEITQVPRPSKKEEKIIAFLKEFAAQNTLSYQIDAAGNMLFSKPAYPGYENKKAVILQGHTDMVAEKNESSAHNFETDPLCIRIDGDWVKAEGTTLGADNGIGAAAMMTILANKEIKHGPLTCLFTIDEESGMIGAGALSPDFLKGDILLNLDTEEDDELDIGCAGGVNTVITLSIPQQPARADYQWFQISVSGLNGGHSGIEIHKGLGNALKILVGFLHRFIEASPLIGDIKGGGLSNAIPREASVVIGIPSVLADTVTTDCAIYEAHVQKELAGVDTDVKITCEKRAAPSNAYTTAFSKELIFALHHCPHGVLNMSREVPGLVDTSTNLASIKTVGSALVITTSQRSFTDDGKEKASEMTVQAFENMHPAIEKNEEYPGWKPNAHSEILKVAVAAYEKFHLEKPKILAVHAGLECGVFAQKNPKLDMISFGPTILSPHSPDERVNIPSVLKFWNLLLEVLENIPEK
ncbi:MAG: aminoacyl-histidine dipeptidase [Lactobacillales bacterium]|nr:aminoacyl-histidine dipeptidase [Lactobacillales bacterium]